MTENTGDNTNETQSSEASKRLHGWNLALAITAVISGLWVLTVTGLLIGNRLDRGDKGQIQVYKFEDPSQSEQMQELMGKLEKNPNSEEVKADIRELDLELRAEYFRRLRFSGRGAYLLLGGMAVFFVSLRVLVDRRKEPPMPDMKPKDAKAEDRESAWSRAAVTAISVLLVGSLAWWGVSTTGCALEPIPPEGEDGGENGGATVTQKPKTPPPPSGEEIRSNWPGFRGPYGMGIATTTGVPETFNVETGENVLWKVETELSGKSSPTVWGDTVLITGATEPDPRTDTADPTCMLYAYDLDSGDLKWQAEIETRMKRMEDKPMGATGFASPSPACDGRFVVVLFGTGDVACFDMEGEQQWHHDLGAPKSQYGMAASPRIFGNLAIIQYDQGTADDGLSKLIAYDLAGGEKVYETDRPVADAWASPTFGRTPAGVQVLTNAAPWAIAYDPETGEEIWRAELMDGDVAASPVYADGLVYVTSTGVGMFAIGPDGSGNVTDSHVEWDVTEGTFPDTNCPLTDGTYVWTIETGGTMQCFDAKTGDVVYNEKLRRLKFYGSPTLVEGKIYIASRNRDGDFLVFGGGGEFEEIARSELGEPSDCSPAFVDGRMVIRGEKHLFCIGTK